MFYQTTLETGCLITYITYIRTLSAICAFMCYQIPLFTDWLITHFTRIWTLTLTYITGISAFITVYMKLFIQSTLVKKRLNIRIYFDRKKLFLKQCIQEKKIFTAFAEMCYSQKSNR